MTWKTEKTQTREKNRLIRHLSYLAHASNGYGSRIGPVFSTSREECRQVVVDSIPLT